MKPMSQALHAALRKMFSCCASPSIRTSSDNGSDDETFATIKDLSSGSLETSSASTLYGPGVYQAVTQLLQQAQGESGDAEARHAPTAATTAVATASSAEQRERSGRASTDTAMHPTMAATTAAVPEQPESARALAATATAAPAEQPESATKAPADTSVRAVVPSSAEGRSDRISSAVLLTTAAWQNARQRQHELDKLSIIHRCSTLEGRNAASTHKISLSTLQLLAPRGHPGDTDAGGPNVISVRATILAHHIVAAPAAAAAAIFPCRNGPSASWGPASTMNGPATTASTAAYARRTRWVNLLRSTSPAGSFSVAASAAAFPVSASVITGRPSSMPDLRVNSSLPAGASAYLMRVKTQHAEDDNTLAAAQDLDCLGSAASLRSSSLSVSAAGW